MATHINAVTQAQPVQNAAAPAAANPKAAESKPSQAPTDTVSISNSAKAILQEVQETHAQTVKEANKGDAQAKRLLAKEEAAANTRKG
jgi:hypothetical protein